MNITLKVGKVYETNDGRKVVILSSVDKFFIGSMVLQPDYAFVYSKDGRCQSGDSDLVRLHEPTRDIGLTDTEARTLTFILDRVGGKPETSMRGHADSIARKLREVFTADVRDYCGDPRFRVTSNSQIIRFAEIPRPGDPV